MFTASQDSCCLSPVQCVFDAEKHQRFYLKDQHTEALTQRFISQTYVHLQDVVRRISFISFRCWRVDVGAFMTTSCFKCKHQQLCRDSEISSSYSYTKFKQQPTLQIQESFQTCVFVSKLWRKISQMCKKTKKGTLFPER